MKNQIVLQLKFDYRYYAIFDLLYYHNLLNHTKILTTSSKKERTTNYPQHIKNRSYFPQKFLNKVKEIDHRTEAYEFALENPQNIFIFKEINGTDFTAKIEEKSHGQIEKWQVWSIDKGWIPWSRCYYYTQGSKGPYSLLANTGMEYIRDINPKKFYVVKNRFKNYVKRTDKRQNKEKSVKEEDYILLLLQSNDERRISLSDFENQKEFYEFVLDLFPSDERIYVKQHPFNRENWIEISENERIKDVSNSNFSEHELYENAKAFVTINSTTAIEGLLYGKKVFTYGPEVFSNKRVTYENINNERKIENILDSKISQERKLKIKKFVSFLEKNQLDFKKCYNPSSLDHYFETRWFVKQIKSDLNRMKIE